MGVSYALGLPCGLHWQFARSWDFYGTLQAGFLLSVMKTKKYKNGPPPPDDPRATHTVIVDGYETTVSPSYSIDYALGLRYSFTSKWSMWLEISPGWPDWPVPEIALGVNYTF